MKRGMTLLEVLVAVAVLATGVAAMQRLLRAGVATVTTDGTLTRAMLAARAELARAEVEPPPLGHVEADVAGDAAHLHVTRDVVATPHPALRQVTVRVWDAEDTGQAAELVEVVRVPSH